MFSLLHATTLTNHIEEYRKDGKYSIAGFKYVIEILSFF